MFSGLAMSGLAWLDAEEARRLEAGSRLWFGSESSASVVFELHSGVRKFSTDADAVSKVEPEQSLPVVVVDFFNNNTMFVQ